ncbi:hypothetical protein HanXRQr2_Chr11g0511701 [Helianthus annuus]|uniref:Uncharacterized protein n=1 Tax=Helianthus annuus TaxID=4232 RepID=A0A9K3N1Q2_HELAN|nr:hypothetical protein HanXRQr2_Chr11g0511701 [Helianthus annuus]
MIRSRPITLEPFNMLRVRTDKITSLDNNKRYTRNDISFGTNCRSSVHRLFTRREEANAEIKLDACELAFVTVFHL